MTDSTTQQREHLFSDPTGIPVLESRRSQLAGALINMLTSAILKLKNR